jgi:hypothetical protein
VLAAVQYKIAGRLSTAVRVRAFRNLRKLFCVIQPSCERISLLSLGNFAFLFVVTVSDGPIFIAICRIATFRVSISRSRVDGVHILCLALLCDDKGAIPYSLNPLCAVAGGAVRRRGADVLSDSREAGVRTAAACQRTT